MRGKIELNFSQGQMIDAMDFFLRKEFLKEDNFTVNGIKIKGNCGGIDHFTISITANENLNKKSD